MLVQKCMHPGKQAGRVRAVCGYRTTILLQQLRCCARFMPLEYCEGLQERLTRKCWGDGSYPQIYKLLRSFELSCRMGGNQTYGSGSEEGTVRLTLWWEFVTGNLMRKQIKCLKTSSLWVVDPGSHGGLTVQLLERQHECCNQRDSWRVSGIISCCRY